MEVTHCCHRWVLRAFLAKPLYLSSRVPNREHNRATAKALEGVTTLVLDVKDPSAWEANPMQTGDSLRCRVT